MAGPLLFAFLSLVVLFPSVSVKKEHFPADNGNKRFFDSFVRSGKADEAIINYGNVDDETIRRENNQLSEEIIIDEKDTAGWRFDYRNTDEWARYYPECNGTRQSPIDLDSSSMKLLKVASPLTWRGYNATPRTMTITNTGHSVELNGFWDKKDDVPYISGGTLLGDYVFAQLHFHWGSREGTGSEHTINNRSLDFEMHMVHYKKDYGSPSEATKYEDGYAAVGVTFQVSGKSSSDGILLALEKYAEAIKNPKSRVEIRPFPLSKFNVHFTGDYVSYLGSMTTPPCCEIVTWNLPAIPYLVTRKELDIFRSIKLLNGDDHNYRPIMPLNGRIISYIP